MILCNCFPSGFKQPSDKIIVKKVKKRQYYVY